MKQRIKSIDALRGLMIVFVVLGHSGMIMLHNIIFLFHMPIFFMITGVLQKERAVVDKTYITMLLKKYGIPYIAYLLIAFVAAPESHTLKLVLRYIWGGRSIGGVWWYISCLMFSLVLFNSIRCKAAVKPTKCIFLAFSCIAILESHITESINLFEYPGVPLNLDVALLATAYIGVGYYCKNEIRTALENKNRKLDFAAVAIIVILITFCIVNNRLSNHPYYFDMKYVYYKELVSAFLIPCLFGYAICRFIYWVGKSKIIIDGLAFLGRMTIPIMFLHIIVNQLQDVFNYGALVYVLIGIGIPVFFTLIFCRFSIMRTIFGLPDLCRTA